VLRALTSALIAASIAACGGGGGGGGSTGTAPVVCAAGQSAPSGASSISQCALAPSLAGAVVTGSLTGVQVVLANGAGFVLSPTASVQITGANNFTTTGTVTLVNGVLLVTASVPLSAGQTYSAAVTGLTGASGNPSNPNPMLISFTTPSTPTMSPTNLTLEPTDGALIAKWTGTSAQKFTVCVGLTANVSSTQCDSGALQKIQTTLQSTGINGLSNGTTYFVTIVASELNLIDSVSSAANAKPVAPITPLKLTNTTPSLDSIAYGNGKFVAVGQGVQISSDEGLTWTHYSPNETNLPAVNKVLFFNNEFIAYTRWVEITPAVPNVSRAVNQIKIYRSVDGKSWSLLKSINNYSGDYSSSIYTGGGKLVIVKFNDDDGVLDSDGKTRHDVVIQHTSNLTGWTTKYLNFTSVNYSGIGSAGYYLGKHRVFGDKNSKYTYESNDLISFVKNTPVISTPTIPDYPSTCKEPSRNRTSGGDFEFGGYVFARLNCGMHYKTNDFLNWYQVDNSEGGWMDAYTIGFGKLNKFRMIEGVNISPDGYKLSNSANGVDFTPEITVKPDRPHQLTWYPDAACSLQSCIRLTTANKLKTIDGVNWVEIPMHYLNARNQSCYGSSVNFYSNKFVVFRACDGKTMSSVDGEKWASFGNSSGRNFDVFNNQLVGLQSLSPYYPDGKFYSTSDDGLFWITKKVLSSAFPANLIPSDATYMHSNRVRTLNNVIYTASAFGAVVKSQDGSYWDIKKTPVSESLWDIGLCFNKLIAVGSAGSIITSVDSGTTWIKQNSPTPKDLYALSCFNGQAIAMGKDGVSLKSTDGVNWTEFSSGNTNDIYDIYQVKNKIYAVGDLFAFMNSSDGLTWSTPESNLGQGYFWRGAYGNGRHVLTGSHMFIAK
jgi:hypothetical protein